MVKTSFEQSQDMNQKTLEDKVKSSERCFVISRGRTQHPKREIQSSEYWIGSGEGCDLRLGMAEIPTLHSVLKYKHGFTTIEVIDSAPALLVNAEEVRSHLLTNGDLVEIGPFQLEYRQEEIQDVAQVAVEDVTVEDVTVEDVTVEDVTVEDVTVEELEVKVSTVESFQKEDDEEEEEAFDISSLSAEELIDLLEADMNIVEESEQVKQDGLESLAEEVQSRLPHLEKQTEAPMSLNNEVVEEFVQITHQLCEHVVKLEQRVSRISQRDGAYTSAFSDLLESQKLLSAHLETLVLHLASVEQEKEQSPGSRYAA